VSDPQSHPGQDRPTDTASAVSPDSGTHWTEPGAWPVAPGVHRIPLPLPMDGLKAVNVYVLEHDDGLTLIDGGWAIEVSRQLLERSLADIGRRVSDIRRFLVTHVHRDHYTQAITIRREVGSHISLGIGDRPTLDLLHGESLTEDPYVAMLVEAGAGETARQWEDFTRDASLDLSIWGYPDAWLEDDHTIAAAGRDLDAVHTPGHTQGHFVFADRAGGLLFAGDHVLPTITPSIGFEPLLGTDPLGDFMASLTKVRGLPDLTLLPAHGPVAGSSHARVDELLAHHDERLSLSLAAVRSASSAITAHDVAAGLPWTRHHRSLAELDAFNAAMATLETRAHLHLLVARGQLARSTQAGVAGYSLPD
jgi:glyoxylase-like metal-dependent hydrolase (beta-lactamase superfamily II)